MSTREIKFRAWDETRKIMYKWSDLWDIPTHVLLKSDLVSLQFTGLYDKKGKEIYEGDIVSFACNMTADDSLGLEPKGFIYDEDSKHVVEWSDEWAAWQPQFDDDATTKYRNHTRHLLVQGQCEIVGNIYETV